MTQDNATASSPATGMHLIAVPQWLFVVGFAVLGTLCFAYDWATPRDKVSVGWFLADLLFVAVMAGTYLIQLARVGWLRLTLAVLPFWVVGALRRAAEFVAEGWAGGWILGVLGAVAGALSGVVAGRLFARWFVSMMGARNGCGSGASRG